MDETKPVDTGQINTETEQKSDSGITETTTAEDAGKESVQGVEDKKEGGIPHGAQEAINKRIDELTRKRHEAEREAAYWKGKAEGSKPEIKSEIGKQEDKKPVLDDFKTYDEFNEALVNWATKQVVLENDKKRNQEIQAREKQRKATEIFTTGKTKYKDFEQIVTASVPITDTMADIILSCKNPIDVTYHISKNIELCKNLASLNQTEIALEIGRIDGQYNPNSKSQKSVSQAPKPITSIGDTGSSNTKSEEEMSDEEWIENDRRKRIIAMGRK